MQLRHFWIFGTTMVQWQNQRHFLLSSQCFIFHSVSFFLSAFLSSWQEGCRNTKCLICLAHHPKGERAMASAGLTRRMRNILVQKTLLYHWSESIQVYFEVITLPRVIYTDWLRHRFSELISVARGL